MRRFVATSLLGAWMSTVSIVQAIWNPIITGWNPDPSMLRVGDDYYVSTSSGEGFPALPIYHSKDLSNWTLISHGYTRPEQVPLYGTPTSGGVWAPTLSYIDGKFWLASMMRWTYDPVAKVWPRVFLVSSDDMVSWSDPLWCEPWGIDPALFQDPATNRTYLNLMAPNNNADRIWGISQCEVSLLTGNCVGPYVSLWNGTLPHNNTARPEGPKMFHRDNYYYLLIAEGGTDQLHRATIARSKSPSGPFEAAPDSINPLIYNGQYGFTNLTVQSTGHATMFNTPDDDWYAVFLARRNINGTSPLGRETFLTEVKWKHGWPIFNDGNPITISEPVGPDVGPRKIPEQWTDDFSAYDLDKSWYQLRTPYTKNYKVGNNKLVFKPNVFELSDRDVPAAVLRKQKSLNMTISAEVLGYSDQLGTLGKFGIAIYLSEFQHQSIGLRRCVNQTGTCLYTELLKNGTSTYSQTRLNISKGGLKDGALTLHIRATPLKYHFGYSIAKQAPRWMAEIESSWQAFAPPGWFVFSGASWALFATGEGEPWPFDAPEVGFTKVVETYYEENIPDYDRW